jgi:Bacterial self-protective colicin-like immunity
MSEQLPGSAIRFTDNKVSAADFSDEFIRQWKQERDDGKLQGDSAEVSEALSSIFCFADLYGPGPGRDDYELDEARLRDEVSKALKKAKGVP